MSLDWDNDTIAKRLRDEKQTIQKLAFALGLLVPQSKSEIDSEVHRVCEWINDACEALAVTSTEGKSPQ